MTKALIVATAAFMSLSFVAEAMAQNRNRGRTGNHGISAKVDACVQANRRNNCVIRQNSNNNVAGVVQAGRNNNTDIRQRGRNNSADVNQTGNRLRRN